MKRVGILGGTFNPPHIGHLIMANEALHAAGLDEIRFMPNFIAPHKEMTSVTAGQRLAMVELAIEGHGAFSVEEIEIRSGGVSFTVETMERLTEREPDTEFHFLIGGDMIDGLHTWHRIDDLVRLVRFVGVKRPGYEAQTDYPVQLIDAPEVQLSSTELRRRAADGGTLKFLVPEAVEMYIRKERLYGPEPDASKGEKTTP